MQQLKAGQEPITSAVARTQPPVVLHIIPFLRGGGAETFVRELIPGIVRRGIDARILCAYGDSRLTAAEATSWAGRVYCIERSGVSRLNYFAQMRQLVREISPDIVHTHGHVGATWGRAAAVLEQAPIIIHTEHVSKDVLPVLQWAAHKVLNPRTDVTVMLSQRTADIVQRRENIRKLRIIPNGIRVRPAPTEEQRRAARQTLGLDPRYVIFGMIANLEAHKKPALAIDAVARLAPETRSMLRLAFFGDGTLRTALESRIKEVGIQELVRFYGFRNDLVDLLPGLDVVMSTSAREMMPMSLLEAMNAALPVIGVPHAGTLDLVIDGETGIVLDSWDAQSLADAMERSLESPHWRVRAGAAAYAHLKANFDIEKIADQYVKLYWELLRRNSAE